jgi:Na+/melibiose symporter-like transporter
VTTADRDPALATEPKQADRTLGELFAEMTRDLGDLFRKEVELARVETKDEVSRASKAAGALAGAGVGALLFLIMVSTAAALGLDEAMHPALAFLIVAVVWAIIAAVLYTMGRNRLKQVRALPETTETLKEDMEWAKTLRS